ncbi:hypothetical protein [Lyngbya confervoides]|uniref:Uncharacterized protein n=1 Tax=Lyngbya confervoides BDU141951 TaxID=1574623 RepID=A0ABD4T2U8_9CYAN|nr:hypothetical protein [Lyngbya confervoides]MCM1982675.1 hypothetical protein [Lyngbya confervoides BDU141951]
MSRVTSRAGTARGHPTHAGRGHRLGATQILNVRLETSRIGQTASRSGLVAIEVIACGTGIR